MSPGNTPNRQPPTSALKKSEDAQSWERVAAALEGMAVAIGGLAKGQEKLTEGLAGVLSALTGNADAIHKEVKRQDRRNQKLQELADEIRGRPSAALETPPAPPPATEPSE